MPIRPENLARYPTDWPEISARIRERAGNRCEFCSVPNGVLGGRLVDGTWFDAMPEEDGLQLVYPKPGTWSWCSRTVASGLLQMQLLRIVRIVLTVAHLDHQPEHCEDDNLKALCQRCHLAYDQAHHAQTAYRTRREGRVVADLFGDAHAC